MKFIALFISVIMLSGCLPSKDRQQIVSVTINNVQLEIPKEYFVNRIPPSGSTQKDVGLAVVWPDFSPLPISEQKLWEAGRLNERIRYVVSDPTKLKPLPEFFEFAKSFHMASVNRGDLYGLKYFGHPSGQVIDRDELFVLSDESNKPRSLILCAKPESAHVKNALCKHIFAAGPLYVQASYHRKYLSEWKNIEQETKNLISKLQNNKISLGED